MDGWEGQKQALGVFIRQQRLVADLSLRELAALTSVSNAYLSQIERGLHQPSLRVLRAIADALHLAPSSLLARAGLPEDRGAAATVVPRPTEEAIRVDEHLTDTEKDALIAVYRSYRGSRPDRHPRPSAS